MSQISDAIESMSGNELLLFLTTFDYKKPTAPDTSAAATRPDLSSPDYGDYYNDLQDAGTLDYEPDTWSEVEYWRATGKLDNETYYAALEDLTGSTAEATPADNTDNTDSTGADGAAPVE